jgi:hypothetical protein
MYAVDFNNRFFRVYAVTIDKYGIDPLLDKIVPKLLQITTYSNHPVVQDERGAPDLISLREYGVEDYWWHIMTYNGICRFRDITEGMTLRMPTLGSIIAVTNDVLIAQPSGSNIAII